MTILHVPFRFSHGQQTTVRGYQLDCVSFLVYSRKVVASFRHKGLLELYLTGKTRRIGPEYVRKCVRILQSQCVAEQPGDNERGGVQVPQSARQRAEMVRARHGKLPHHVRLVRRKRGGCRF
jgi:hypothetical protein